MNTRRIALLALAVAAFVLLLPGIVNAQTVIVHQPPTQRVIVEHHYPQGVTYIPGQGGSRTIVHGGHYGPSTCYRECFHQGRGTTVVVQQRPVIVQQPRSGFSIGGSFHQFGGRSGFSIGGSYHDYR